MNTTGFQQAIIDLLVQRQKELNQGCNQSVSEAKWQALAEAQHALTMFKEG